MSGFITEMHGIKLLFQAMFVATALFLTVPCPLCKALGALFSLVTAEMHKSLRKTLLTKKETSMNKTSH